jgi:hypothetical protein
MSSDSEQTENNDSEDDMLLRRRVELYLRRTRTAPTRLGRDAVNDPRFVYDLRMGRQVGEKTASRVHAWLDRREVEK